MRAELYWNSVNGSKMCLNETYSVILYITHYNKYCKILSSVIRAAKKMYYDSLIQKSTNKVKMTWDIVKSLTNNKTIINKTNTRDFNNTQKTAIAFNQYFSTVAEKLIKNSSKEYYQLH